MYMPFYQYFSHSNHNAAVNISKLWYQYARNLLQLINRLEKFYIVPEFYIIWFF